DWSSDVCSDLQPRIEGDPVARQHRLVRIEADLRLGVPRRSRQERDPASSVIANEVLDHRLHAGPIVENQAWNSRQLDADAADLRLRESFDEPRDAGRARTSTAGSRRR